MVFPAGHGLHGIFGCVDNRSSRLSQSHIRRAHLLVHPGFYRHFDHRCRPYRETHLPYGGSGVFLDQCIVLCGHSQLGTAQTRPFRAHEALPAWPLERPCDASHAPLDHLGGCLSGRHPKRQPALLEPRTLRPRRQSELGREYSAHRGPTRQSDVSFRASGCPSLLLFLARRLCGRRESGASSHARCCSSQLYMVRFLRRGPCSASTSSTSSRSAADCGVSSSSRLHFSP